MAQRLCHHAGPAFFWICAVALAVSLFLPWYSVSAIDSSSDRRVSSQFYLWGVTTSSSGVGADGSRTSSYSSDVLPHTGGVYAAALGLVLVGIAGSTLAGAIALRSGPGARQLRLFAALVSAAVVTVAPLALIAVQPGAICSDAQGFEAPLGSPGGASSGGCTWQFYLGSGGWYAPGQADGPQGSFTGHDGSLTWGPGVAWFLSLGAGLVLATESVLTWRSSHFQYRPRRDHGESLVERRPD